MKAAEVRNLISSTAKREMQLPANDSDRFNQIYDLVEMMLADGIVDEAEMDFCISMAARLGFKKSIVGLLVRKISTGVKDGLPRDEIKREAQTLLDY